MAITLVSNSLFKSGFSVNGSSADLSGCEELVAAVAGKSIFLTRAVISFGASIAVTVGAGETSGAVTSVLIGPIYGAVGTTTILESDKPIKLPVATSLTVDASGSGDVTIMAEGFIA